MEIPNRRPVLENVLAALQAENQRLKEIERLKEELAALQTENRRKEKERLVEEVAELQAENRCLKEIERREEELAALQLEIRRLNELNDRFPTVDKPASERLKVQPTPTERDWTGKPLTEEEIQSVRCAEDVFGAAMECVRGGKATLIYLSAEEVNANCGGINDVVQISEAADVGDWLAVLQTIIEGPEHYCACPVLYSDEDCLILAASLESEATERLLKYVGEVAQQLENDADKPRIDTDAITRLYDSF